LWALDGRRQCLALAIHITTIMVALVEESGDARRRGFQCDTTPLHEADASFLSQWYSRRSELRLNLVRIESEAAELDKVLASGLRERVRLS
jgi:hypothetical protein